MNTARTAEQTVCRLVDDPPGTVELVRQTLLEDIGRGDITTRLTVPEGRTATAEVRQKSPGVLAGGQAFENAFALHAPGAVTIEWLVEEGSEGDRRSVALLRGPARALLTAERTGLNIIQRLSGVASMAREAARRVEGTGATVLDTRKTTPGMRALEKYAVRVGGARNHRFGLDDGILIKDNHVAAAGGVNEAVRAARTLAPPGMKVEVEVSDLSGLDEAIAAGADIILLDNMTPDQTRQAVERTAHRALLEASGGVTLDTVRAYAKAGVEFVSLGALTHSAKAVDFSLDFQLEEIQ